MNKNTEVKTKEELINELKKRISAHLKIITPKLRLGAHDWNKAEKEAIAAAYFEITKMSTGIGTTGNGMTATGLLGKGRVLDTGCSSCVNSALSIIKNFLAAAGTPIEPMKAAAVKPTAKTAEPNNTDKGEGDDGNTDTGDGEEGLLYAPSDKNWRKNHETIDAAAVELDFVFSEEVKTKQDKIEALEAHIKTLND